MRPLFFENGGYDNVPQGGSAFSELDDDDGDLPF